MSIQITRQMLRKYVVPLAKGYLALTGSESFEVYVHDVFGRCADEDDLRRALGLTPEATAADEVLADTSPPWHPTENEAL